MLSTFLTSGNLIDFLGQTLEGLYKIETNLYFYASTNHDQAEIEHYKKECFFRQYRKYCMWGQIN